jgi:hypothetical protein
MGFLDSIFGRDKKEAPVSLMTPEQQRTQKNLLNKAGPIAESSMSRYGQPYPGELTTKYEQQGLKTLGDYLSSPTPTESPLYQGAAGELERTLSGDYDPVGSQYYQSYRTAVMRELQEAKDRLANEKAASEKLFGGGMNTESRELEEGAVGDLAVILGQMFENERNRKLQAVPLAQSLMGAGEGMTQARIGASQSLGGLEFQREYGDYIRQLQESGIPLETAINLATTKNEYYQPGYEPSFFERAISPILQAGAMGVGAGLGGGRGFANLLSNVVPGKKIM